MTSPRAPSQQLLEPPPLRADPWTRDGQDGQRIEWVRNLFHSQDDVRRALEKSIEENIRMLCGQHYLVWNQAMGRWYDISKYLTDAQQLWYYRPVVNWVLFWFMLNHARMTENPPIITFQPATLDRIDQKLCEVMDPIFKRTWRIAGMDDINDAVAAWLLVAGEAYINSRIDTTQGDLEPWVGPAMLPLLGPDGQPIANEQGQPTEHYVDSVPYGPDGNPRAELTPDEQGGLGWQATGEPHAERSGEIDVEFLSPHQVRGEWGSRPWHKKRWHCFVSYESVFDLQERFGVQVTPTSNSGGGTFGMQLSQILMGSGHYGTTSQRPGSEQLITNFREGYALVYTFYHRPSTAMPGTEESQSQFGGRRLILTQHEVLYDGQREARFPHTSGIRQFQMLKLPGRTSGSTPQEALNPINRAYNKGVSQILLHRDRVTNPITLVDSASGITKEMLTGEPGLTLSGRWKGTEPIKLVAPGRLEQQVFETQSLLMDDFKALGSIHGAEGTPPTRDPSGELVKELRSNSDRYLGSTQKRSVTEYARTGEDWIALNEVLITKEKAVTYAGRDQMFSTITVFPELFSQGKAMVVPDIESMLPEGRGERELKVMGLYEKGAFGMPGGADPMANKKLLEMVNFPHLGRLATPGGIDAVTAAQENGQLAAGTPAQDIQSFEWYDHLVHLQIHEEAMKTPEFKTLPDPIKGEFIFHRQVHLMALQAAMPPAPAPGEQDAQPGAGPEPPPPDAGAPMNG